MDQQPPSFLREVKKMLLIFSLVIGIISGFAGFLIAAILLLRPLHKTNPIVESVLYYGGLVVIVVLGLSYVSYRLEKSTYKRRLEHEQALTQLENDLIQQLEPRQPSS